MDIDPFTLDEEIESLEQTLKKATDLGKNVVTRQKLAWMRHYKSLLEEHNLKSASFVETYDQPALEDFHTAVINCERLGFSIGMRGIGDCYVETEEDDCTYNVVAHGMSGMIHHFNEKDIKKIYFSGETKSYLVFLDEREDPYFITFGCDEPCKCNGRPILRGDGAVIMTKKNTTIEAIKLHVIQSSSEKDS